MGNEARVSSRKLPPQIGSAGFPLATQWPVPKRLQEPYPPSIHAGADLQIRPTAIMMKRKSPQANSRQITNLGGPPSLLAQISITEDAETLSRYLLDQANAFHRRRCAAEKWVMRDTPIPTRVGTSTRCRGMARGSYRISSTGHRKNKRGSTVV